MRVAGKSLLGTRLFVIAVLKKKLSSSSERMLEPRFASLFGESVLGEALLPKEEGDLNRP